MDRIRNYLDGLEFHDSSPEPSNSQVPSSYGVQSVNPSELVTGRVLDQKSEDTNVRPYASMSAPSRASSVSSSLCFSTGRRSTSTISSLSSVSPERGYVSSDNNGMPHSFSLPIRDRETLYEDFFRHSEHRENRVLVTSVRGSEAFRDRQQLKSEKEQLVKDDLDKEKRHLDKERRQIWRAANQRQQQHEGKRDAKSLGTESKSRSTHMLSDLDSHSSSVVIKQSAIRQDTTSSIQEAHTYPNSGIRFLKETEILLLHDKGDVSEISCSKARANTDSVSSEDATDWDEDSDEEGSSNDLQFQLLKFLEGRSDIQKSLFHTELSPMKSRLIDELMSDFWGIFGNRWSNGTRQHGYSSQSTSSTTPSEYGTASAASRDSSSVRYGKRSRSDEGEDEEIDDHHGRRKRAPVDKLPAVKEDNPLMGSFACPFRKHDPRKYTVREWPRCALKPQKTIARLKAHLYQYHLIEQCPRCKLVFEDEEMLETHNMSEERCEANTDVQVDGMTRKMKDQIQCRKKPYRGQTEAEKWEQIYKILFPAEVVPDPTFEPVLDHNIQRTQSPDSVSLAEYEAYLRRVLPSLVRNALEAAVNNELQPIEAQIQQRMIDIIQDAQNQAFTSFHDMHASESKLDSSSGTQANAASRVDDQPPTGIETFFQPPPPANPESFTSLPELRIPKQNTEHNQFSDSGYASRPSLSSASQLTSHKMSEREPPYSSRSGEETGVNSKVHIDPSSFFETSLLDPDLMAISYFDWENDCST